MNYSIIRLSGQQFKVKEGDEILVGKLKEGVTPEADVLFSVKEGKAEVGAPTLSKKVKFEVLTELEKGEKLYVSRYNAKSRYRKRIGFRPQFTRLKVTKID